MHCSPILCRVWLKADEFIVVAQAILTTIQGIKTVPRSISFSGKQITDTLFERSMATTTCLSAEHSENNSHAKQPRWGKLNRLSGTYTKIHVTYHTCKPSEQLFANRWPLSYMCTNLTKFIKTYTRCTDYIYEKEHKVQTAQKFNIKT